jgi:hypothetical protein
MRHLKTALATLAVVGVVGGALAFKTSKFGGFYIYQKSGTACPVLNNHLYDTDGLGTQFNNVKTSAVSSITSFVSADCAGTIKATQE